MRSAAKHRSDSAVRNSPTQASAQGHAQIKTLLNILLIYLVSLLILGCSKKATYTPKELPSLTLTQKDLESVGYKNYLQKSEIIDNLTQTLALEQEKRSEIKSQLKFFLNHLHNTGFKYACFNRFLRKDSVISFTVNYYLFDNEKNAVEGKNDILKIYELLTPGTPQDDKTLFRSFVGQHLTVRSWMRSTTKEFLCLFVRDNLVIAVYCPYLDMTERIMRLSIKHLKDNQQYDTKVPYLHVIEFSDEHPRTDFIPSPNDRNYNVKDSPDLRKLTENVHQEWLAFYRQNTPLVQNLLENVASLVNNNELEKVKTLMFPGQSIPYFEGRKTITPYDSLYKYQDFFIKRIGKPIQIHLVEKNPESIRFGQVYRSNYQYPVVSEVEFKIRIQGKNTTLDMYAGICVKMKQLKLLYFREM
ncbi:MAG: hypothetical protein NZ455_05730 [Bacteroidia bacterium]|nr:hypothetical protein [Bacteroidia bacterium]MDW8346176.1 hypothetical protein [Bacteroidia bacterium]